MLAKVHLMSFGLSQVLVLIIMISHSTGKQSYKRTQRASEMQCNAMPFGATD